MNWLKRRKRRKEKKVREYKFFYWFARTILWIPIQLFFHTKVYGTRNIGRRKVILVMNHKSAWDPLILSHFLRPAICFMAKEDLAKNKFVAWILKHLNVIFVKRGEADMTAVEQAFDVLEDGRPFALFPEGTRNKQNDGVIRRFKTGAAFFALESKAPVIPIAIEKSAHAGVRNRMIIGPEFDLSEFYSEDRTSRDALKKATEKIYRRVTELNDIFAEHKDDAGVRKAIAELDEKRPERERLLDEIKERKAREILEMAMKEKENADCEDLHVQE